MLQMVPLQSYCTQWFLRHYWKKTYSPSGRRSPYLRRNFPSPPNPRSESSNNYLWSRYSRLRFRFRRAIRRRSSRGFASPEGRARSGWDIAQRIHQMKPPRWCYRRRTRIQFPDSAKWSASQEAARQGMWPSRCYPHSSSPRKSQSRDTRRAHSSR